MSLGPLPKLDIRYIAGIIDGEGSIDFYRSGRSWAVRLRVGNTYVELLRRLRLQFGGWISRPRVFSRRWKPYASWDIAGPRAERLLADVLPYLIVKRAQAITALQLRATVRRRSTGKPMTEKEWIQREVLRLDLQAANKKGA